MDETQQQTRGAVSADRQLTVLTYNLHLAEEDRLPLVLSMLRRGRPDLIALQEVADRGTAERLARGLGMHAVFGEANDGVSHLAWLSHLPVRRSRNQRLPALAKTLLELEVAWRGMPVRAFAIHLASRHDQSSPEDEIAAVLNVWRPLSGQPHLVVGDFNALRPGDPTGESPSGEVKRGDAVQGAARRAVGQLLEAGYQDCYRAAHPRAPGYTYPSHAPWLRLDFIFVGPGLALRVRECDVVSGGAAALASDHLPVRAEFSSAE